LHAFRLCVLGTEPVTFLHRPAMAVFISSGELLIGRRDVARSIYPDIDLGGLSDFGFAARRHARVSVREGRLFVTHLAVQPTTAVNDPSQTLSQDQSRELHPGDRLMIGEAITFVVEAIDEEDIDEPAGSPGA
jgi:hypothetical protein